MRYAYFDEAGRCSTAHNDDTVTTLPDGAVALSAAQWNDRFSLRLVGGELVLAPVVPPVTVPRVVTMRQARLALLAAGLLAAVDAAIAAMPGAEGDAARIEWEFATHVERQQPLVLAMAGALTLTEQQLDNLFVAAALL